MSISSNSLTAEDSDIILNETTKNGGVFVKVLVKPLDQPDLARRFIF